MGKIDSGEDSSELRFLLVENYNYVDCSWSASAGQGIFGKMFRNLFFLKVSLLSFVPRLLCVGQRKEVWLCFGVSFFGFWALLSPFYVGFWLRYSFF